MRCLMTKPMNGIASVVKQRHSRASNNFSSRKERRKHNLSGSVAHLKWRSVTL